MVGPVESDKPLGSMNCEQESGITWYQYGHFTVTMGFNVGIQKDML